MTIQIFDPQSGQKEHGHKIFKAFLDFQEPF